MLSVLFFLLPSTTGMALSAPKAVSKVCLLTGDGIGPEITVAARAVLDTLVESTPGMAIEYEEALIGGAALDATGNKEAFPESSLEACRRADSVLLACIGGPKWDGNPRESRPETGLLRMRKEMGLFANLRPATVLPQLVSSSTLKPEIVSGVDLMVVRELTGDVDCGAFPHVHSKPSYSIEFQS